jgi:hypothetical protein
MTEDLLVMATAEINCVDELCRCMAEISCIGEVLGWLATLLSFVGPMLPSKRGLTFVSLVTGVIYMLHYAILGGRAWGAVGSQLLSVTNAALAFTGRFPRVHQGLWLALVPIAAATSVDAWDLLPHVSMLLGLLAFQCSELSLRILAVISTLPWIPYALRIGSHSTLASCAVYAAIQTAQITRLLLSKQRENDEKTMPQQTTKPMPHAMSTREKLTAATYACFALQPRLGPP